jgi:hypothetical protein
LQQSHPVTDYFTKCVDEPIVSCQLATIANQLTDDRPVLLLYPFLVVLLAGAAARKGDAFSFRNTLALSISSPSKGNGSRDRSPVITSTISDCLHTGRAMHSVQPNASPDIRA